MMQGSREGSIKKEEKTACLHANGGQTDNVWEGSWQKQSLRKLEGMRPSEAGI